MYSAALNLTFNFDGLVKSLKSSFSYLELFDITEPRFLILRILRLFVYPVKFEDHFTGAAILKMEIDKIIAADAK